MNGPAYLPCRIRRVSALLAATAMFVALGAAPAPAAAEVSKIVVHTFPASLVSLYPHLGVSMGFYKGEGLDASTIDVNSSPEANAALAGGSVQFILISSDNLVLAASRGLQPVAVVGNQIRNFYSLVVRKDLGIKPGMPLQQIAKALEGKRLGVIAPGTNNERFSQALLMAGGIDASKATYVALGSPANQFAAMRAKSIDAHLAWEPFQTLASLMDVGVTVVDCRAGQCPDALEKPGRAFQVYATTRKFAQANPNTVAAFVRAHQKIHAWALDPANRPALLEAAKRLVPPPPNIDPDKYAQGIVDGSMPSFGTTIDPKGLDAWSEQLLAAKLIPASVPASDMIWPGTQRP